MDELDRLVKAVEMLKQSVEIMVERFEQLFQLQEAQVKVLPQLAEHLTSTKDNLEIMHEAFVQSLDQLEQTTDDLASATAGLLVIQQQQNSQEAEDQGQ